MNYHVFIVDENTFKYHLEYGFAGTGAGDKISPFLFDDKTNAIHSTTERNLVGMIADISRVKIGDKIIFYLQASQNRQGMFFGIFRAISTAFFDENDDNNYLKDKMYKGLSFRILIEPDEVYPIGITEHEYLDSLEGKKCPYQMCWSLIYRKLKGARGCTMITQHEYLDLLYKLKSKNDMTLLDDGLSYDRLQFCITKGLTKTYEGNKHSIDILPRLLYKAEKHNAFEVHLQAYLLQNFDKEPLKTLLLQFPQYDFWIGNEVSCGVGMQRIDIMTVQQNSTEVFIKIVELKCDEPSPEVITNQIPWYIQWVTEYIAPNYICQNKRVHISPCIIAKYTNDTNFLNILNQCSSYNINPWIYVSNVQYIPFAIKNNNITF
ncbi:MAG: hypothetical protein RSF40_09050 [Oscillospiraceae bacterium]